MLDILLRRRRNCDADRVAVVSDEGRDVACFLRSDVAAFPSRFRQGIIRLEASGATWRPGMYGRGQPVVIQSPLSIERVRPVGGPGERNIKRHQFSVIEAKNEVGRFDLAVPTASVELVASRVTDAT